MSRTTIGAIGLRFNGTTKGFTATIANLHKVNVPTGMVDFVDKLHPKDAKSSDLSSMSFDVTDPDGNPTQLLLTGGTLINGGTFMAGAWRITATTGPIALYNGLWQAILK